MTPCDSVIYNFGWARYCLFITFFIMKIPENTPLAQQYEKGNGKNGDKGHGKTLLKGLK